VGRGSGRPSPTDIRLELLEDDSLPEIEDMKDVERGEGEAGGISLGSSLREIEGNGRVLGDRDYPSSHEAMQTLDPRVYQIYMDFE